MMWVCCEAPASIKLPGPRANIAIVAFATRLSVGAQGKDIDLAMYAGIQVLIRGSPGIIGQAVHISAPGILSVWRFADQGLQPLLCRRIAAIVQPIQLERLHQGGDILSSSHGS